MMDKLIGSFTEQIDEAMTIEDLIDLLGIQGTDELPQNYSSKKGKFGGEEVKSFRFDRFEEET